MATGRPTREGNEGLSAAVDVGGSAPSRGVSQEPGRGTCPLRLRCCLCSALLHQVRGFNSGPRQEGEEEEEGERRMENMWG